MISLGQVVDADMNFRAAGHPAGRFFADEEIRMAPQAFCSVDGIMVGQGDDGHAQSLATGIDLVRLVIRLFTKAVQPRGGAHSRGGRVDVKVASHAPFLEQRYEQSMKLWKKLSECFLGNY